MEEQAYVTGRQGHGSMLASYSSGTFADASIELRKPTYHDLLEKYRLSDL